MLHYDQITQLVIENDFTSKLAGNGLVKGTTYEEEGAEGVRKDEGKFLMGVWGEVVQLEGGEVGRREIGLKGLDKTSHSWRWSRLKKYEKSEGAKDITDWIVLTDGSLISEGGENISKEAIYES